MNFIRFTLFAVSVLFLLSGCGKASIETNDVEFVVYEIKSVMPKIEYRINSVTDIVTIYFPVVTNKEITGTELGGVAAKLPPMKGNIKVTLRVMPQNKINYFYQDKYISFLEYQLNIENGELLQAQDIINLCDTTLWIYHDLEFQKIQVDEDYLQITMIENQNESFVPDWDNVIFNVKTEIEHLL